MERTTLEILLNKVESDTLDFKREQYRFYGAADDEKSELLKDILAFANGWKETAAHILVGVEENAGCATVIVGSYEHLADNDVQQFINSKTNKPVKFAIENCSTRPSRTRRYYDRAIADPADLLSKVFWEGERRRGLHQARQQHRRRRS